MAGNGIRTTVIGQLTADPELRKTKAGVSVASFTLASNERSYDEESKRWIDGDASFLRCSYWRDGGENFTESNEKGNRVIATGYLKQNNYTDRDGNERSSLELVVDEAGPSNQFANTEYTKRKGNGNKSATSKPKAKAKAGASTKASANSDDESDDDFDF